MPDAFLALLEKTVIVKQEANPARNWKKAAEKTMPPLSALVKGTVCAGSVFATPVMIPRSIFMVPSVTVTM